MIVYILFWAITLYWGFVAERKTSIWIFFIAVFFFVGLRLETGFDWPVYKEVFQVFLDGFSWQKITLVQLHYSQESGFLFLLGLLAQVIPSYEIVQSLLSLFFLYSFFKLSSAVPGSKPALAIAIFFSFYLLSVGFSTVRQALSLSLFNMALYFFLNAKRPQLVYVFLAASVAIHLSAIAYVVTFVAARLYTAAFGKAGFVSHLSFSALLLFGFPSIFFILVSAAPWLSSRANYYQNISISTNISLFSIVFAIVLLLIGSVVSLDRKHFKISDDKLVAIQNLIMLLSSASFASLFFLTLRDRISYELIALFSIYVSARVSLRNFIFIFAISALGIYYQMSILAPPRDLAFIPYQNSLIYFLLGLESTGEERSSKYMEIFIEELSM
jgi:hypothetical protein